MLGRGIPRRLIQYVKERLPLFGPVACPRLWSRDALNYSSLKHNKYLRISSSVNLGDFPT